MRKIMVRPIKLQLYISEAKICVMSAICKEALGHCVLFPRHLHGKIS
jgi:hypothetical protein